MGTPLVAWCLLVLSASIATAQTPPPLPPPSAPAPAPTPAPTPAQWVRLSLADGRFVDGQITGGDAVSYFVQTSHGYFSIARANVVAVTPLTAPASPPPQTGNVAPMPPPMPAPTTAAALPPPVASGPLPPPAEKPEARRAKDRAGGLAFFGLAWGITAIAASAKSDNDDSAKLGFIPVVGPTLWAVSDDEDDFGEDGWDYLGMFGSVCQGAGLWAFFGLHERSNSGSSPKVTAISTGQYTGLSVAGQW